MCDKKHLRFILWGNRQETRETQTEKQEKRLKLMRSCRKTFCYDRKYYLVNVVMWFTAHERPNGREIQTYRRTASDIRYFPIFSFLHRVVHALIRYDYIIGMADYSCRSFFPILFILQWVSLLTTSIAIFFGVCSENNRLVA